MLGKSTGSQALPTLPPTCPPPFQSRPLGLGPGVCPCSKPADVGVEHPSVRTIAVETDSEHENNGEYSLLEDLVENVTMKVIL